jgi:hypothetical protein
VTRCDNIGKRQLDITTARADVEYSPAICYIVATDMRHRPSQHIVPGKLLADVFVEVNCHVGSFETPLTGNL